LAALAGRMDGDRAADLCGRAAAVLAATAAGTTDATLRREQEAALSVLAPRLDPLQSVELLAGTLARDPTNELAAALTAAVARVGPGQTADLTRSAKPLVNALAAAPPGPEKAPANPGDVRPTPRAVGLAALVGRMDADRAVALLRDAIAAAPNTRGRWELVRVFAGVTARLKPDQAAKLLLDQMSDTSDPLTLQGLAGDVSTTAARMEPDAAAAARDRAVEVLTQPLERTVTPARDPAAKLLAQGLVAAAEPVRRGRSSAACTKAAGVLVELVAAPTRFLIKEDLADALAAVAVHTDHDHTARLLIEAMRKAKHEASAGGLARALAAITPLMESGQAAEVLDEAAKLLADAVVAGPPPPVFSGRALAELTRQMDPAKALAVVGDALGRAKTREAREVFLAVVAATGRRAAAQPAAAVGRAERAAAGEQASRAADALLAGGQPDAQVVRAGTLAAAVGRMDPDEAGRLIADAMRRCKNPALLGSLATTLAEVAPRMAPAKAADACDSACGSLADALDKIGEQGSGRGLAVGVTAVAARMEPGTAVDALTRAMGRAAAPDGMTELLDGLHAAAARAGGAKAAAGYEAAAAAIGRALETAPNKYAVKIHARLLGVVAGRMPPDKAASACAVAAKALLGGGVKPAVSLDLSESLDSLEVLAPHLSAEATEKLLDLMAKNASPFVLSRAAGVVAVAAARLGAERAGTARQEVVARLAAAAGKTPTSHELAALATGLATVTEKVPRGEASKVCDPIARRLTDAMAKDTNFTALAALGRGVTALAPRLEPARGREVCGQAAKHLADAMSRTSEQGQLITLGRALAEVAGALPPDQAAEVCDRAARRLVSATAVKRPDEVWLPAPVFVALCARTEPVPAALQLSETIARTTNAVTLRELEGGLSAAAARTPPAHFARAALDAVADDPVGQKGAARLLWVMSGLAGSRDRLAPASALVVGAFALPPGALSGLAAAHAHLPLTRPLPAQTLTDLLKHPFCVGHFRRDVLDALGTTHGRQFADQWEFIEHVRANKLPLDLQSPPEGPKVGAK
jgi:hypothetical protein